MIHVDTMRFVDRYAGVTLCWLLSVVRLLSAPFARKRFSPPRKVLIIKLSEMGSTVLAYPAITALNDSIPDLELFFLTFATNRALLDTMLPHARVLAIDVSSAWRMLTSGFGILWRLRRERIDTTIDMDFFSRVSAIVAYLVCDGRRVGFHRFTNEGLGRGRLLTHPVLYSAHVHTSVAFMALARALQQPDSLGLNARIHIATETLQIPRYLPEAAMVENVWNRLVEGGCSRHARIILINPNSSDLFPLRRWPLGRFAELCRRLLEEYDDAALVITGTASEQADANAILDHVRSPRCMSLAGKTTFEELLALYSMAHALVTNDSGPAHFAALLRTPTVVLFGPETPVLYSPLNPHARVLYSHFACSPCVSVYNAKKSPCTRSLCLEAIAVSDVLRNVRAILDLKREAGCLSAEAPF